MSVVKPEGEPAASVKPGQKSYVRSSGKITLSAQQPSDGTKNCTKEKLLFNKIELI
jgi:hypothetical protein